MIFIGTLTSIDTDESDWDTDNAEAIAGTYDSFDDLEVVDITNFDTNDDGAIYDDEAGSSDYVTYSQGGTSYTQVPDATVLYNAIVTEADGTQHTIEVVVVQMANGDTFVGDQQNNGTMDNLTIRSIELTNPTFTNAAGYNTYQTTSNTTVCFANGTYITTNKGDKLIETLSEGDLVATLDDGYQPIRWIGSMVVPCPNHLAPIQFATGSLGPNVPTKPLVVSPHHRILVRSLIAQRMFGKPEVLVAAKSLKTCSGVTTGLPFIPVKYWHMLFDRHQLVKSHGVVTESLLPAQQTMKMLPKASVDEILSIFPRLKPANPARFCPTGKLQRRMAERHARNKQPLQA